MSFEPSGREDRLQDRHHSSEGITNFSGVQQQESGFVNSILCGAHLLRFDLDDVELETALLIRSYDLSWSSIHTERLEEPPSPSPLTFPEANHGFTRDKRTGCCAMGSSGLVDCQGCLDGEVERLSDYLDEEEKVLALEIVSLLNDAGQRGIGKKDILVRIRAVGPFVVDKGIDAVYFCRLFCKHQTTWTCIV